MSSSYNRFGIMDFDALEVDSNFINYTENDFIIIFLDGTVKRAFTNFRMRTIYGKKNIYIGKIITKELGIDPDQVASYNYLLNDDEYASAWQMGDKLPTEGHPVVYITDSVTMVVMLDDKWTREKLSNVDPKTYALSLLNEANGEPSFSEADISYINLSDHDLYMATNGTIVKLPCFDKRNEADRRRMNEIVANNGLKDVVNSFSRNYEIVISFAKSSEGDLTNNGRARAKALLFERGDYGSEYPLRPKDFESDLMMFFYTWEAADHFIKTTKNSTNYVIKTAAKYFDDDKEAAVHESKVENKKNMTAVAKICAAMIGTGIVFAGTKLIFDYVVNKKKDKESFGRIMSGIGIRHMVLEKTGTKLASGMLGFSGASLLSSISFGGKAMAAIGTAVAAAGPVGVACTLVVGGAAVAAATISGISEAVLGGILGAVEDIPVIGTIVTGAKVVVGKIVEGAKWLGGKIWSGTKFVGGKIWDGIKWVGGKCWDGIKWVGSKVADGISWLGDKIGGFFGSIFG